MGNYAENLRNRLKVAEGDKAREALKNQYQRTNIYICDKCRHAMVTIDVDEGVTPMFTTCEVEGCGGTAASTMYRAVTMLKPSQEWYRPTDDEVAKMHPATIAHVKNGGLILRPHKSN